MTTGKTEILSSDASCVRCRQPLWVRLMTLLCVLVMAGSCSDDKVSYCAFKAISPEGWSPTMALHFKCEDRKSVSGETLKVVIRHDNTFPYRDITLMLDVIDKEGKVEHKRLSVPVADEYGNWLGVGFGTLYQCEAEVKNNIATEDVKMVVLWLALAGGKPVPGISEVGVVIGTSLSEKK